MMAAMVFAMLSCGNSKLDPNTNDDLTEKWGITYSHVNLGAYPDLFSKYWVYAFDAINNSDTGLKLQGKYPKTRFFSFSVYNDRKGEVIDGLYDSEIEPDRGCVNPYRVTTDSEDNTFTIYILKEGTDLSLFPDANEYNVCYYNNKVECVSVCLRHYLGVDEFGGVSLPSIQGVDLRTGKTVAAPEPQVSLATIMQQGNYQPLESDELATVPFLLAPRGEYFPNSSTEYLYCRTRLGQDHVLAFSFIPVPVPESVEEYATAKARYWSICIGSVQNTRSYCSFYDKNLEYPQGEKVTVIVLSKNNPQLAQVKEAAKNIPYSYVLEWDETIVDDKGTAIGEIITVMYRNILPDRSWEYSISNLVPTPYGNPYNSITDAERQVAHMALGDYGPLGIKYSTAEFLQSSNLLK